MHKIENILKNKSICIFAESEFLKDLFNFYFYLNPNPLYPNIMKINQK